VFSSFALPAISLGETSCSLESISIVKDGPYRVKLS
jgi:hypothetical protein